MGIEFSIVSDSTKEGFYLGKGLWEEDAIQQTIRNRDVGGITAFLKDDYSKAAEEIARAIVAFVDAHADWRIINGAESEIWVADEQERIEHAEEFGDEEFAADEELFPVYAKVGGVDSWWSVT